MITEHIDQSVNEKGLTKTEVDNLIAQGKVALRTQALAEPDILEEELVLGPFFS